MTDRYTTFIVILEKDVRDDDAEAAINAIRQIKGVLDVQPHQEITEKLWQVLYGKKEDS